MSRALPLTFLLLACATGSVGAQVQGHVVTWQGTGISRARVSIQTRDTLVQTLTDHDGAFHLPRIEDGSVLTAEATGYGRRQISIAQPDSVHLPLPLAIFRIRENEPLECCPWWDLDPAKHLDVELLTPNVSEAETAEAYIGEPIMLRVTTGGTCTRPGPISTILDGRRVHVMVTDYHATPAATIFT